MQRTCKSFHLYFVSNFAIWLRTTVRQTLCQLHEFQTSLENCLSKAYAMQHIYAEWLPNVRRARFWSAVKSECEIWLAEDCEWRQAFAHYILIVKWCNVAPDCSWQSYGGPQLSRQNRKRHGKTKNVTAKPKTKNLMAKTKYLTAKPKTSRQNQILHSKNKIALVLTWVFAFEVRYLVFAVKYLVLPWGLWFCRESFGFVVRCFIFAVRFSVLLWGILFLPWGFWFCRDSCGSPYKADWSSSYDLAALWNITWTQVHQINNKLKWS